MTRARAYVSRWPVAEVIEYLVIGGAPWALIRLPNGQVWSVPTWQIDVVRHA